MKRTFTMIFILFSALSVYGQSNEPIQLNTALKVAAERIDGRFEAGSKIALLNFSSSSKDFSTYVLDELTAYLVDSEHLTVVDRSQIDLIRSEQNFQYSGDVDDDSAVALGRMLGAQFIVSGGSLTEIDNVYRMVIRVLNVQTAAVEVQYRTNILKDRLVKALIVGSREKTVGQKIRTGALNVVFGLGSYLERDFAGGITITAGYAVAAGLMVIEAVVLDWDSPAAGVPATIGVAAAGLSIVYGFARPFIYNRSPRMTAIIDNTSPGIVLTSDNSGGNHNYGFQLTYTIKF